MPLKFISKSSSDATTEKEGSWVKCPKCGVTYREPQYYCQNCHYYSPSRWMSPDAVRYRPRWRRRLFIMSLGLLFIGSLTWSLRLYIPNPFVMLRQPVSDLTSQSTPGEWTAFAYDAGNTRYIPTQASFEGRIRWSYDIGYATNSSPAVKDGTLYVGGHFKVHALEAATGRPLWEAETTGPVHSSPAIAGRLLFLGLLDGRVLAMERSSGKLRWDFNTGNFIFSTPTVIDGVLYIGSGDGAIYALDAETSELFWKTQTDGNILSTLAIKDDILYAMSSDRKLYILDAKTGARRLHYHMYWAFVGSPVVENNLVYFVTNNGRLYTLKHGVREFPGQYMMLRIWLQFWLWRLPVPQPPPQPGSNWRISPNNPRRGFGASPAVTAEALYIGDKLGTFYAKNAMNGKTLWEFKAGAPILASPLVLGDKVYFGTKDGDLYALDRHKGKLLWKSSLGAPIMISPVYGAGLLFVRTADGMLYAIE